MKQETRLVNELLSVYNSAIKICQNLYIDLFRFLFTEDSFKKERNRNYFPGQIFSIVFSIFFLFYYYTNLRNLN